MPLPPSVLLLGHDAQLVDSRRRLLESHGFKVHTPRYIPTLNQTLEEHDVDLMVTCNSLSDEDCERARALLHSHPAKAEVMALCSSGCCASPLEGGGDKET